MFPVLIDIIIVWIIVFADALHLAKHRWVFVANLTGRTSPPNSTTDGSRLIHLLILFLFTFTFAGAPYRIFFLFLLWFPCHFYLLVIEQQHRSLGSQYTGCSKKMLLKPIKIFLVLIKTCNSNMHYMYVLTNYFLTRKGF